MSSGNYIYEVKNTDLELFCHSSTPEPQNLSNYSLQKSGYYEEEVQSEKGRFYYILSRKSNPKFTVEGIKESLDGCSVRGVLIKDDEPGELAGDDRRGVVYRGRMFSRNTLEQDWTNHILEVFVKENVGDDDFRQLEDYSRMLEFNYDTRVISVESPARREIIEKITVDNGLLPLVPHGYGEYNGEKGLFVNGILFQDGIAGLNFDLTIDKLHYKIRPSISVTRDGQTLIKKYEVRKGRIDGNISEATKGWKIEGTPSSSKEGGLKLSSRIIAKKDDGTQYEGKLTCYEDIQFNGYGKLQMGKVTYEGCFLNNEDMVTCRKTTEDGEVTLCRIEKKKEVLRYKEGQYMQDFEGECHKWAIVTESEGEKREWLLVCRYIEEDFLIEDNEVIFYSPYDKRRFETGINVIETEIQWKDGELRYEEREKLSDSRDPDDITIEIELSKFKSSFPNKFEFLENEHCLTSPEIPAFNHSTQPIKKFEEPIMELQDCTNNAGLSVFGLSPYFELPEVSNDFSNQGVSDEEDSDLQKAIQESQRVY